MMRNTVTETARAFVSLPAGLLFSFGANSHARAVHLLRSTAPLDAKWTARHNHHATKTVLFLDRVNSGPSFIFGESEGDVVGSLDGQRRRRRRTVASCDQMKMPNGLMNV